MMSQFSGHFLYQIQGTMHGRNISNYLYEGVGKFESGLADVDLFRSGPESDKPLLSAFTTHHVGDTDPMPFYRQKSEVPHPGTYDELSYVDRVLNPPDPPSDTNIPAYRSTTGLYPFTEMGTILLNKDGTVSARVRLNVAGDFKKDFFEFDGKWVLDASVDPLRRSGGVPRDPTRVPGGIRNLPPIKNVPSVTGIISLHGLPDANNKKKFVWDLMFGFVSRNEAAIMAAGRRVRPAIASGRMWRI